MRRLDVFLVLTLLALVTLGALFFIRNQQTQAINTTIQTTLAVQPSTRAAQAADAVKALGAQLSGVQMNTLDTAGWQLLTGDSVSLVLPPSYQGGLIAGDVRKLMLDHQFSDYVASVDGHPDRFPFFALDTTNHQLNQAYIVRSATSSANFLSVVDQYVQARGGDIIERTTVDLDGRQAVRLIANNSTSPGWRSLEYFFYYGQYVYQVNFKSHASDFYALLPIFETSARTVVITKL